MRKRINGVLGECAGLGDVGNAIVTLWALYFPVARVKEGDNDIRFREMGYEDRPKAFIATQGPMSHTVVDFWRMIWHCNAPAIVMITKLVEKHGIKCELYLPNKSETDGSCTRISDTTLKHDSSPGSQLAGSQTDPAPTRRHSRSVDVSVGVDPSQMVALPGCAGTYGDIHVRVESMTQHEGYSVRTLLLRDTSASQMSRTTSVHIW